MVSPEDFDTGRNDFADKVRIFEDAIDFDQIDFFVENSGEFSFESDPSL
jgi:hypothetical protein